MSIYTSLLNYVTNFNDAITQLESKLAVTESETQKLHLLTELSYCYAHVQLQKGLKTANEAIALAEQLQNEKAKANALCARAMNLFRIGFIAEAHTSALQALAIFKAEDDDNEGICDAFFQLGSMPYLSVSPGDTPGYLDEAIKGFSVKNNATGIYLARIQKNIQLFFNTQFDEAIEQNLGFIKELTVPGSENLLCFTYMQMSLGMYIKQDIQQFVKYMQIWQQLAQSTGNFHDFTMTKTMLADCYRIQKLDKAVMEACIEAASYCEQLGSIHGHSTLAIVMANVYNEQGLYDNALEYYNQAIALAQQINDGYKNLMAMNSVAQVLARMGNFAQAYETLDNVLIQARAANDRLNLISAQRTLADIAYAQGEFDRALIAFKNLFELDSSATWHVQDYGKYAACINKVTNQSLINAGIQPAQRRRWQLMHLQNFLNLATEKQIKREQANAFAGLAEYYEQIDDLQNALDYRKKYIQLYEDLVNEQSINSIAGLRMQYESEKKEQEIALLKKENEQTLLNERLRISRDLHDDMGATLSSISVYSAAVKQRLLNGNKTEAIAMLDRISEDAQEMVSNMGDMVWMINPQNDSVAKLLERMQNYSINLLLARQIEFGFNTSQELMQVKLDMETRKNIFLFFKEAINNAAKYSGAKSVKAELIIKGNELNLSVTDNGTGFDTRKTYKGNGLPNMQQRAAALNGTVAINSSEGTGTTIGLWARLPINREAN